MTVAYSSGSIHFTGLGSDTDFDSMITQLKQVESYQMNRFKLWQADWNRRIDAFQQLNTAMVSLNSTLNSMNTMDKFLIKTGTSSNESVISAVASGSAQNNSYRVEVNKLATNCSYTYEGRTFSSTADKVNTSGSTQNFIYTYKGKTVKVAVGANATLQQFINQINNDANNPGVRASVIKNGSDYIFQLQGMDTGSSATLTISPFSSSALEITPPSSDTTNWETDKKLARMVSETRFSAKNTVINLSNDTQNFVYNYNGVSYSVAIDNNDTLKDLANKINANTDSSENVRAEICKDNNGYYLQMTGLNPSVSTAPEIDSSSSTLLALTPPPDTEQSTWSSQVFTFASNNMQFASPESVVNNTSYDQNLVIKFNGNKYDIQVSAGDTLLTLAQKINEVGSSNSFKASITCEGKNNYRLSLINTEIGSTSLPSIDISSSPALGFSTTGLWQSNNTNKTLTYSTQFNSAEDVINNSGEAQNFVFIYNGNTETVSLANGATLNDLVNAINDKGISGLTASLTSVSGKKTLKLTGTDSTPAISAESSKLLNVGPGTWSSKGSTLTFTPELTSGTVINNSGTDQTFSYIYKGETKSVTLSNNATAQDLIDAINSDETNSGILQAAISNGKFTISGIDENPESPQISDASSHSLLMSPAVGWGSVKNGTVNTLEQTFDSSSLIINNSGATQKFSYTYGNKTYSVDVPDGTSLAELADLINENSESPDVMAALELDSEGKYSFRLIGLKTGSAAPKVAAESSRLLTIMPPDCSYDSSQTVSVSAFTTLFNSEDDVINSSGQSQKLILEYQGKQQSITVAAGTTLKELVEQINSSDFNIRANLLDEGGQKKFQLWGTNPGTSISPQISISSSSNLAITPPNIGGDGWYTQICSNAQIKLNNWPAEEDQWIESETNSPEEIIEGVTLNLKEEGTTQITITTNSSKIKEQIVALVDALNEVRSLISSLTKVDSSKETTDIEKTASAFDAQMGSILTGNYGVQLLSSKLKSTTASAAQGFSYRAESNGVLSGDLFVSLSQVGITTIAESNDPNFGLLTIDEEKLDRALSTNAQAVAELFAADNIAVSNSSDFAFSSYISGTTSPGSYQVKYNIDADGNIVDAVINGYSASYDSETGQLTSMDGPSKGLALYINNMQEGAYQGVVTLKMGKVGELAALTKELNSDDGILSILTKNYKNISDNIQSKIDKEEDRLTLWERNMRSKFSRLEATLSTYKNLASQVESQIKQLSSNKS